MVTGAHLADEYCRWMHAASRSIDMCVRSVLGKVTSGIVTLLIVWFDNSLTAQHKVRPVGGLFLVK